MEVCSYMSSAPPALLMWPQYLSLLLLVAIFYVIDRLQKYLCAYRV
jgi:hypothetical protein